VDEHDHPHVHGPDCEHDHDDGEAEEQPDVSEWASSAQTTTCPACETPGAVMLGGGIFCPTCGEVSTNVGYQPPPAEPDPG
jgi:hypothetical protein